MFSSTELFPLDWEPTTAIWGKSIGFWTLGSQFTEQARTAAERITYSYCGKDILQLVHQGDQPGVVDVDPDAINS